MENFDIRHAAKENNVKLWEIAEAIGLAESTFCRKLRRELPSNQKAYILCKIEQIAECKVKKLIDHETLEAERLADIDSEKIADYEALEVERRASHENLN